MAAGGNFQTPEGEDSLGRPSLGSAITPIAGMGSQIIDATTDNSGDKAPSTGAAVGKWALSGAALGASFGPIGAGVGAVVGAGVGLVTSSFARRKYFMEQRRKNILKAVSDNNMAAASVASDPSRVYGNAGSNYFAGGGMLYRKYGGGGPIKDKDKARKVDTAPDGYQLAGTEGSRTYYRKDGAGNTIPAAVSGGTGDSRAYQARLQQWLSTGTSPEELAQKKYISAGEIDKYRPFYKASSSDIVYTEPGQKPVVPADKPATAFEGQVLYDPAKHATARINYQDRNSPGQNSGGMLNTQKSLVQLMFTKPVQGLPVDSSKGMYQVPADVFSNRMSGGTNVLKDTTGLSKYRVQHFGSGGDIHIKPSHKGRFTAYKARTGKTTEEAMHSKNPAVRKMAVFAHNAARWKHETGGPLSNELLKRPAISMQYAEGGTAQPLSSNNTIINGPSHADGGVDFPEMGAQLEGGETTAGNFVFSEKLGFAKLHKPIAKAIGTIEKKPMTKDRLNALELLRKRERNLAAAQEHLKEVNGIQ